MSVVSVKELFRKGVFEVGQPRVLTREWACVLSDGVLDSPIDAPQIAAAIPIEIGSVHPTYAGYKARKITITEGHEGSPYHVHVVAEYGVITANEMLAPAARAPVWEFTSSAAEVPAFYFYTGDGNGGFAPLTNSASDFFPGLVTQEAILVARVTKNFSSLPYQWTATQNFINDAPYLGGPAHTWKVAGATVAQTSEDFGNGVVTYWKATAELQYRPSTHNLLLPDIGFNFIEGNQKRRAMVFDFQNGEWVPSPNPVGLDGLGGLTLNAPAILPRRVLPVADFQLLFGSPPTLPLS